MSTGDRKSCRTVRCASVISVCVPLLVGIVGCSDGRLGNPEVPPGGGQVAPLIPGAGVAGRIPGAPGNTPGVPANGGPGATPAGEPGAAGGANACAAAGPDTGPSQLRRLTRAEYASTLQHLLQLSSAPDVSSIPPEAEHTGFTVYTNLQTVSAQHLRAYLELTQRLAAELLADEARRTAVVGCDLSAPTCLAEFVARFGLLAYRRPLLPEESSAVVMAAERQALDTEDRYRFALEALLLSPSFLYRVEVGAMPAAAAGPGATVPLTAYEFAARLSFGMLGRGPSAAMLEQAGQGTLDQPAMVVGLVSTLVEEPEFQAKYREFFEQWLGFGQLVPPKEPPPDWDDELLLDMSEETEALLDRFAFGGRSFLAALTTDETVLSPELARYYDLPEPGQGGGVTIPAGHPRAGTGLLTHASLLSQKTDGDRIALRGNWLRRTFLCRNLEIPEDVAELIGERFSGLSPVEIVRERYADPACRGCHGAIDPIGVGFEGFDATGRFDPDFAVPDYGIEPALPDAPEPAFTGVAELAQKLAAMPEVSACIAERTFLFVHGRDPSPADRCAMEAAAAQFAAAGYDFKALVQGLMSAPGARLRKLPAAALSGGQL